MERRSKDGGRDLLIIQKHENGWDIMARQRWETEFSIVHTESKSCDRSLNLWVLDTLFFLASAHLIARFSMHFWDTIIWDRRHNEKKIYRTYLTCNF